MYETRETVYRTVDSDVSVIKADGNINIKVFISCSSGMETVREADPMSGGTAVGSGSDRLEEMKTELSQTKLELESALKSQHKHLKELDTLR